jgi:signal transduction histidine kinase/CheY-like chemotaxis protein
VSLAMLTVSVSAISGRILGHPANPQGLDIPAQIVAAQTSLIVFALLFYFVAALEEARRDASLKLRAHSLELEEVVKEKEMISEAKTDFIAMLGHEIRNPLASLLFSLELLKVGGADAVQRAQITESMEDSVGLMNRLLEDMLDVARIARKNLVLRREFVIAGDVLGRAAEEALPLMHKNKHQFSITLPDTTVMIDADPVRIRQVVSNLLINAAKYTPEGGSIELHSSFDPREGVLDIRVKDTGIGLSEEEQKRIFEPFTQINPGRTLKGGIGLGLTLAQRLVELHEGMISVRSDGPGLGSEFIVRIPAHKVLQTQIASEAPQVNDTAQKGIGTVLVVDDNVDAARSLSKLLEHYGFKSAVAHSGTEALEKAMATGPDTIVLDIGLPDISGFEVAKRLRAARSSSLLIALSGYGQDKNKSEAREIGFDHYFTKPVSVAQILDIIAGKKVSSKM